MIYHKRMLFSPDKLLAKIADVLAFAVKNINRLTQTGDKNEVYAGNVKWSDKITAETLLIVLLLARKQEHRERFSKEIDEICRVCMPLARSSFNKMEVLKSPKMVLPFAFSHIMLRKIGYPDEEFDFILHNALRSGKIDVTERIPFRMMDLRWGLSLFTNTIVLSMENILVLSILHKNCCVMDMSSEDEYAFTHSLFYITDFGQLSLPASVVGQRVKDVIDQCLAKNVLTEDLDLLGEFLVCSIIVGNTSTIYFRVAISYLFEAWDQLGFLPSPGFIKEEYLKLKDDEATSYVFKNIYHTYYVGGILCIYLLSRSDLFEVQEVVGPATLLPREETACIRQKLYSLAEKSRSFCEDHFLINTIRDVTEAVHDIARPPLHDSIQRHLDTYPHLLAIHQEEGSESRHWVTFVYDALLIQSVRDHHIPAVCDLMLEITAYELAITPAFFEAINYLIRQQLPSGSLCGFFFLDDSPGLQSQLLMEVNLGWCLSAVADYFADAGTTVTAKRT